MDNSLALNIARITIASIAVIGDLFMANLFFQYKRLWAHQYNRLVLILIFSDCLLGIGIFIRGTYAIYSTGNNITSFSPIFCAFINNGLQDTGLVFGQVAIIGLAIDRCFAIYRPMSYSAKQGKHFVLVVFGIGVLYCCLSIFLSNFGMNTQDPIPACSIAYASGKYRPFMFLYIYPILAGSLFALYIWSLVILTKRLHSISSEVRLAIRTQIMAYISTSMLIICYVIFWGGPFAFNLLATYFNYSQQTRTYVAVSIGLGNGIMASCSVFIYLFKYQEIRECAILFIERIFHIKLRNNSVEAQTVTTIHRHVINILK